MPDVVWNTKQNACATKQTRGLNKQNKRIVPPYKQRVEEGEGMEQNSCSFWTISILYLFEMILLVQNHLVFEKSMYEPS